jgi:hypothetical protein
VLLSLEALPQGNPRMVLLNRSKSETTPVASCGCVPEAQPPTLDARKTVTILFTDIVDSSRLGLALDPEALRNLLARYFGEPSVDHKTVAKISPMRKTPQPLNSCHREMAGKMMQLGKRRGSETPPRS